MSRTPQNDGGWSGVSPLCGGIKKRVLCGAGRRKKKPENGGEILKKIQKNQFCLPPRQFWVYSDQIKPWLKLNKSIK